MSWNLVVFALIGLFAGGAARLFYPGRELMKIFATLGLGMVGSLLGGLLSWAFWPYVEGQFSTGALLMSVCGAAFAVLLWVGVAFARSKGLLSWKREPPTQSNAVASSNVQPSASPQVSNP